MRISGGKFLLWAVLLCAGMGLALPGAAQNFNPSLLGALKWRMIGPFRGGRVLAVTGIPGQPDVYYIGAVAGGIWKTTNGGITWQPIFDGQHIASIGALAIAPSNPKILYAGTGEADMRSDISFGDGMYRSDDGGNSWRSIGLKDTRQIARIIVDPTNADLVLVAVLGHGYGPNDQRGVFRSADGGRSWQKILYRDAYTGAADLAMDPDNPRVIYAALWNVHRPPWSVYAPITGPGGGIFRSTDGGLTWTELSGHGLPDGVFGRVGLAIASDTNGRRIYALIDAQKGGLYRSDDAGATWSLVGTDHRIIDRAWYFCGITVDPKNPDVVYIADVAIYRSNDGGRTFTAFKGAPGGDDYHQLWIDPQNSWRMILGSDQGAAISVDGGATWSSWYNQPTAQFYHVSADNDFPYHVYGAQQDSGTTATLSRSDSGSITFRNWYSVGAGESGYILPDPRDPDIVYGGDTFGGLHRFDRRTQQSQDIAPVLVEFNPDISQAPLRFTWTSPLAFAPWDARVLYFGSQYLLRTDDGGNHWKAISPDLTGVQPGASESHMGEPAAPDNASARGYGVVYSIAPSPIAAGQIWIGTDNGRIQLTRDEGETWANVTPAEVSDWSMIGSLEASHFDAAIAYASVDRHALDDLNPHIYRTHDFGNSWTEITAGIPAGQYVNVVREDPTRRGLLYAGTELGIYVSFDDGVHWQSLQLNLPATSVRDLAIHGADLIAATHGRSFWVLDNVSPLRQMNASVAEASANLLKPEPAVRLRTLDFETPLPREFPAAENPPSGAILDYVLRQPASGEITLDILDPAGTEVRHFSSEAVPQPPKNSNSFTDDWLDHASNLSQNAGLNRFIWDLHYSPAKGTPAGSSAKGPWALPGDYQVRLHADGETNSQTLHVEMDPRVKISAADLKKQFMLASRVWAMLGDSLSALREIELLETQLTALSQPDSGVSDGIRADAKALARDAAALRDGAADRAHTPHGISRLASREAALEDSIESADAAPTSQAESAAQEREQDAAPLLDKWHKLKDQQLTVLNHQLQAAGRKPIDLAGSVPADYNPLPSGDL